MSAWLGRLDTGRRLADVGVMPGALIVLLFFIITDRLNLLVVGVGLTGFVVLCCIEPMLAVALFMLLPSGFMGLIPSSLIPHLQLTGGIRIYAQDAVLATLLVIGMHRLLKRKERPMFVHPLLLLGCATTVSLLAGTISGSTDLDKGLNGLRMLYGYPFYIALVGMIDSPRRFRWLVGLVFAIVIASTAIQLTEVALGHPFVSPFSGNSVYGEELRFSYRIALPGTDDFVPGYQLLAAAYVLVGLFLALGDTLWTGRKRTAIIAGLALWAFMLALVRQWYLYIGLGLLTLLLLILTQRVRIRTGFLTTGAILLGLFAIVAPRVSPYPLFDTWLMRVSTISPQADHVVGRSATIMEALGSFRADSFLTPVLGHGIGSISHLGYVFTDVGWVNTFTQYGMFGMLAIAFVVIAFFRRGYSLLVMLPGPRDRGCAAGLLAVWVAFLVGYSFSNDFFTGKPCVAVGLVMACLDRLAALAQTQQLPTGESAAGRLRARLDSRGNWHALSEAVAPDP